MSTATKTTPAAAGRPAEILKENLEHTIFSWNKQSGLNPLNIESAKGIYLHTRDGRKIIDFSSQLMNVNIGHQHPKLVAAIEKALAEPMPAKPAAKKS